MKSLLCAFAAMMLICCGREEVRPSTVSTGTTAAETAPSPAEPAKQAPETKCVPAPRRLCPADEAQLDPSFVAFRDVMIQAVNAKDAEKERKKLVADYREKFANPYTAASLGYVDEVIRPEETRAKVVKAFEMLKDKRDANPPRKHGNIPL